MAVPVAFFALFFAWPVVSIVERGLRVDDVWQFGRFGETLSRPEILDVLWFTLWQALASTGLTLLIALPGAYVFARFEFRGKVLLRAVVTVPFVMPTVMVGTAFLARGGRGGRRVQLWGGRRDTPVGGGRGA
ncbi:iron ABC transporter permease, partial [Streptomyces sp. NPDC059556]